MRRRAIIFLVSQSRHTPPKLKPRARAPVEFLCATYNLSEQGCVYLPDINTSCDIVGQEYVLCTLRIIDIDHRSVPRRHHGKQHAALVKDIYLYSEGTSEEQRCGMVPFDTCEGLHVLVASILRGHQRQARSGQLRKFTNICQ